MYASGLLSVQIIHSAERKNLHKNQDISMVISYLEDGTLPITESCACKVIVQAPLMTLKKGILYYVDTKQDTTTLVRQNYV